MNDAVAWIVAAISAGMLLGGAAIFVLRFMWAYDAGFKDGVKVGKAEANRFAVTDDDDEHPGCGEY